MKQYTWVNNVVGWVVFAIAAWTYCSTIEPTASFWDCPEFITTANKMEIGHPPGAPFFMLVGKFFSLFASDASQVAKMVNTMSALLSAGCILFLFWSITHLAKRLLVKDDEQEVGLPKLLAIMGAGIGGALIYTWSDTFWFSAVEGEVYAFSSFFTALVFWLILKWEDNADKPHSDRWLVLIAYLVGLSIGVHLLNLLCIPAIVLIYYYKRSKEPTLKGSLGVLVLSMVIVAAVLYGIVPGIVKVAGAFELLFVNGLHMSFNTGMYIYLVLLVAALIWSLWESEHGENDLRLRISFLVAMTLLGIPFYGHGMASVVLGVVVIAVVAVILFATKHLSRRVLNTALLCMTLITVGYASYAVTVIRSAANPPMDQDSPEDVFALEEYLGREQYGQRPLLWGQTYMSEPKIVPMENAPGHYLYDIKTQKKYFRKAKVNADDRDEYASKDDIKGYNYPASECMLFPRVYDKNHASNYMSMLGIAKGERPTQADNMRFFVSYQLNFMYWRYFFWNFVGRQNDLQSDGGMELGNAITGIAPIDNALYGNQKYMPTELKENKGHNVFYCLPLILGLLGLFWQAFRGKRGIQQFWVVFFLFFMTGLAIVLYLNQTPGQPRERDYAYAGSFYAFAIWCGLGVTAIFDWLSGLMGKKRTGALAAACISLVPAVAVPLQMVSQTWDDHDRSDRYVCRDFGLDYLETVPKDGIIFTNGDNDTFPLWYNEDTEGKRTDVRVCNLSYVQTEWYIDQMKRPAFSGEGQSSPLPIGWTRAEYATGVNEITDVNPVVEEFGLSVKDFVKQAYAELPELSKELWGDEPFELTNAINKFVLKRVDYDGAIAKYPQYKSLVNVVRSIDGCLPSDTLYINVDKDAVLAQGINETYTVQEKDSTVTYTIPDKMYINVGRSGGAVYKNFMMMLEMLGQNNFKRPMYMSTTVGPDNYGSLYKHFVQEGLAYRFTPFTFNSNERQQTVVDTKRMFDNMVNRYHYGNLSQKGLYIDETTGRMCNTMRRWFGMLIRQLISEGDTAAALKAVETCEKEIPNYNVPYTVTNGALALAEGYGAAKQFDKARAIMEQIEERCKQYHTYYMSLGDTPFINAATGRMIKIDANLLEMAYGYDNLVANYLILESNADDDQQRADIRTKMESLYQDFQNMSMQYINRCHQLGITPQIEQYLLQMTRQ